MRIDQLSLDEEIRLFFEYMQPQLAVWEKHLQSLKRGELEKLRILDKIDRAIEFDSRGEITEMMRLHRERFATAMDAVIEHNTITPSRKLQMKCKPQQYRRFILPS